MKISIPGSVRVILPLLCSVAVLWPAAPARAQIALVDDEVTTASPISATSTGLLLATNLTVSAAANTLVVVVTFRNNDTTTTEAPATLGWTNGIATPQTLTQAVQVVSRNNHGRGTAIYYLYHPAAGTGFNISGKLSGQPGSSGDMVAYTLSGVDTTIATPPSASASADIGAFLSFDVSGITADSWAAIGGDVAASPSALPITCTNGTTPTGIPVLTVTGGDFSSATVAAMGYISSIIFGGTETFTQTNVSQDCSLAAVVFKPASTTFLAFGQQPQTVTQPAGRNATFTVSAAGNPAVTSYQWYDFAGGVTNLLAGATSASYTTNAPTVSASYYVVVGNGSTSITSSVARLNVFASGTWNTASGSWNTPGNWMGNLTANGVGAAASFVNGLGGTVTLDNAAGFTAGTNIFGVTGTTTTQTPWVINSGTPAGTLTMALDPAMPTSVISGYTTNIVIGVPVITVCSNNTATINAPLAGNQGLFVNGAGTLVLAGGNTNNTYSGPTVIGIGGVGGRLPNLDATTLQIGTGGTSGAIDFINPIYMCGYAHLIFSRSDTVTVSSVFNCQAGKAPDVIVNSGTVILASQAQTPEPWLGAIVNNGGTLVLYCPAGVNVINDNEGSVNITNGTAASATNGAPNGGGNGDVALGINSGGMVRLAGPGGNGVNIRTNAGALDNGSFDLGGDAVQVYFIAGTGVVTNSGAAVATLTLGGGQTNAAYPWQGTIADGTTAQTDVTLAGGTTVFTGPNTYTGNTLLAGGTLVLSNLASLASANISVSGANLILANTPTLTNPQATVSVGPGRTLDFTGMTDNFTLSAGQTLVVAGTGTVNAGLNTLIAAAGSTLVPGGSGTAGLMTINGNLTLNGNTNVFDLATVPTEGSGVNDEIVGVNNLNLSGNVTIQVNTNFNHTFNAATTYRLIHYTGSLASAAIFRVIPAILGGNPATIDTTSQPGYVLLTIAGNSAPLLFVSATNLDGFTGYPVTLPAVESGTIPMTNQWFNGATAVPGATSPTYTFTPVTPGVYTYTLYATNAFGNAQKTFNITVGSPTISIQCAISTNQFMGALYLAPTDTAGVCGVSNWNVISITPSSATYAGITSTSLVDPKGFTTPVTFTAVGVQDGWHEALTITNTDTADARFMNTYWYANPVFYTPRSTNIMFTFTNLPNDTYDVYVYVLQLTKPDNGGGYAEVYDGAITNYVYYPERFGSISNFVTGINTTGVGTFPEANYVKLRISTGGSNSIAFTEGDAGSGIGGAGVPGIQIVPAAMLAANNNTYSRNGLNYWIIKVSDLLTNATDADGDTVTLAGVSISTNGITPVITTGSPAYVSYFNTNLVDDQFSYTVTDGHGGTSSGVITVTASPAGGTGGAIGQISGIALTNGVATMSFAGIPGFTYNVQVSTNLTSWNTIWTTNAPANGGFQFNDNAAPTPDAYYRLMWNGN